MNSIELNFIKIVIDYYYLTIKKCIINFDINSKKAL